MPQFQHAFVCVRHVCVWYLPLPHASQYELPVVEWYRPVPQHLHAVRPVWSVNLPLAQFLQPVLVPSFWYWP